MLRYEERPAVLMESPLMLVFVEQRDAGQLAQLLAQEVARALQLRQQPVERVELAQIPRLQRGEPFVQHLATVADVVDDRFQRGRARVEHAAGLEVRVE